MMVWPRRLSLPTYRAAAFLAVLLAAVSGRSEEESGWYSKYSSYPEYCSTPAMMASRSIPKMSSSEVDLVHVTAVIRHGARTPISDESQCWEGYWSDPAAGVWNCSLCTVDALAPSNGTFFFERRYDGLSSPPRLRNALNGTCQIGQLIAQGYRQQLTNGQHLRDAYFHALFPDDNSDVRPHQRVYFRTDEDQRTTMSGQALLQGLLSSYAADYPTIPLHVADRKRDIIAPNPHLCPRLHELRSAAQRTEQFQAFNSSHADLYALMKQLHVKVNSVNDCIMTTICTDRPLPHLLNDYHQHGDQVFERLLNFTTLYTTLPLKHNEAAYSKLAMAPLWANILDQIKPHLQQKNSTTTTNNNNLALFSGHDDTIMPLLASLGEHVYDGKEWAPYASMIIIEIFNITANLTFPSGKAFRLLYNGRVLTSRMNDCNDNLCDVSVLLQQVEPFATIPWDCESVQEDNTTTTIMDNGQSASRQYSQQRRVRIPVLLVSCLLSAALASFTTYLTLLKCKRYQYDPSPALEENHDSAYGEAAESRSSHIPMT